MDSSQTIEGACSTESVTRENDHPEVTNHSDMETGVLPEPEQQVSSDGTGSNANETEFVDAQSQLPWSCGLMNNPQRYGIMQDRVGNLENAFIDLARVVHQHQSSDKPDEREQSANRINGQSSASSRSEWRRVNHIDNGVPQANADKEDQVNEKEVMLGRKIRRNLPLVVSGRTEYDRDLLDERDHGGKLKAKELEDKRRGARKCEILPSDSVIFERNYYAKGDTRFNPKRYTVLQQNNGRLLLTDEHGQLVRRHVSQTKKVYDWREPAMDQADQEDRNKSDEQTSSRPIRERRAPEYLKNYVY